MYSYKLPELKMSFENEDFAPLSMEEKPVRGDLGLGTMRRKKGENKSRFSDKQVKLLETVFKAETRIEPMKKVQLAVELGLEPRQVTIWFQNRRARWKSKRLENEFRNLKVSYENLATLVGSLKEENHSLHLQVENLRFALERNAQSTKAYDAKINSIGQELVVHDYPDLDELGEISQPSTEHERRTTDVTYMLNQSCCSSQWWDFWNCLE